MRERVAILTAFREFIPGYSLTGIVWDQYKLLKRQGHEVKVFVAEDYHGKATPIEFAEMEPDLLRKTPAAELIDYKSGQELSEEHKTVAAKMKQMCLEDVSKFEMVLTHDLIFTGWNLPYAVGIQGASQTLPAVRWLHWIHSIPSGYRSWWNARLYGRTSKIAYPNRTDARRVAEQYRDDIERVRVIPHPKDLRSWFDFSDDTVRFLDDFPGLMNADVIQIYPASTDRLEAKRVMDVIQVFAQIKKLGFSVSLVVANQHATNRQRAEDVTRYGQVARRNGLSSEEVIFTSNWEEGKWKQGLPKRMVRELFQCSNLFLFPTREETFGLVLPEAVLAGGVLPVLNKSLAMLSEVSGMNSDYIDFGSFNMDFQPGDRFHEAVARIIIGRMLRNEAVMTKTFMRKRYNWDHMYTRFYAPVFADSVNW